MSLSETVFCFCFFFNWEYSCFTLLSVSVVQQMNQLYGHTCPLLFGFAPHWGHTQRRGGPLLPSVLPAALCSTRTICFVRTSVPSPRCIPPALFSLGVHTFVLYVRVSVSALKKDHLYHFPRFHICALIRFSLSD